MPNAMSSSWSATTVRKMSSLTKRASRPLSRSGPVSSRPSCVLCSCLARREHNTQDGLELTGPLRLKGRLALFVKLDIFLTVVALQDDDIAFGIPPDAHRADPELVLDGCVQRCDVLDGLTHSVGGRTAGEVVEQVIDPVGQRAHLLLLQRHAGQPRSCAGLEEEGSLPGRPDRARNEPVWGVELKNRHTVDSNQWIQRWWIQRRGNPGCRNPSRHPRSRPR